MFSKQVVYFLKVLEQLKTEEPTSMADLIEKTNIGCRSKIEKVVAALKSFGLITCKRGKGGGLYLVTSLDKLQVMTVLNAADKGSEYVGLTYVLDNLLIDVTVQAVINFHKSVIEQHLFQYDFIKV